MLVIKQGHEYLLETVDGVGPSQTLRFVEGPKEERISDGVTSEEVINALIDRHQTLNDRFPSVYNERAIASLKDVLVNLEARTADRMARGVEGQNVA